MARTINATWYGMSLFFTAERRIDKNGEESIVFLVATYKTKPSDRVNNYKKRWPIEKVIRTCKQHPGLQECFSTVLETQQDHIAAVLLAYTLIQLSMKKHGFKTPEEVMRAANFKNYQAALECFSSLDQIFAHA